MKKLRSYYMNLRHPQTMERKWIFPLAIGSILSLCLLFLTTLTSSDGTVLSALPLHPRLQLRLRRVEAPCHPHLDTAPSASAGLPDIRLQRRRPYAEADSSGSLSPSQSLCGAFGPRVLAGGALGSAELHSERPGLRQIRECEDDHQGQSRHIPGPHHGGQHAPRRRYFVEGSRGLGLVYQSQCLGLSTCHAGWYQRAKPIIVDPGLYMTKKADVFWVTQRRSVPTAFKLFTESLSLVSKLVRSDPVKTVI
ncbi:hypothetical protein CJ030_MR0G005911 [Morella rubra]|uniref:Uncharacterized protein n=1 Tax=Morella rubra TaxID=262757 RepID=A0A6A1UKI1_9ROSI|nr:hypothetical protein CJ030_MR0G005911 [Morella rubra]